MKVGIDKISMATSNYYLPAEILAKYRNVEINKYLIGIGIHKIAIPSPDEDIISLGANAAIKVLENENKNEIEMVLFATESSVDQSKAAAIYIQRLLELPSNIRAIEIKQACYSGTASIQLAVSIVKNNPTKKVLVVASDIARYKLETAGEPTQGCGAVAMLIAANPRILTIDDGSGFYSEDVMDFWRPNHLREPIVEGKYSLEVYYKVLLKTWEAYTQKTKLRLQDHDYFCYHTPFPTMAIKAHKRLKKLNHDDDYDTANSSDDSDITDLAKSSEAIDSSDTTESAKSLDATDSSGIKMEFDRFENIYYNRELGNCYTASLYVSLLSLLENTNEDMTNKRIGLFSYGSGCVGEFFSMSVEPGYKKFLNEIYHKKMLDNRKAISICEYIDFYSFSLPESEIDFEIPKHKENGFRFSSYNNYKRAYEFIA